MLTQCILVGRLKEWKNDNTITLIIPRSYKNENGEYENDYIDVTIEGRINENTKEYCHKGDVIGVKGRITSTDEGMKINAEKVTFLSSRPSHDDDEDTDDNTEDEE